MNTNSTSPAGINKPTKKAYHAPKLKSLGSVRKLTLKSGSAADGFGTFA